jgi:hypothetical protein
MSHVASQYSCMYTCMYIMMYIMMYILTTSAKEHNPARVGSRARPGSADPAEGVDQEGERESRARARGWAADGVITLESETSVVIFGKMQRLESGSTRINCISQ